MNAPDALSTQTAWLQHNQCVLADAFARLNARLRGAPEPAQPCRRDLGDLGEPAAIDQLATLFGLSIFEQDLLLLAAGVEMDAELAAAVAAAQGGIREPSFGLAMAVCNEQGQAHWSALTPHSPLRRWRLLELDSTGGVTRGRLRIDERILHLLAGINELDSRLAALLQLREPPLLMAPSQAAQAQQLADELAPGNGSTATVVLVGDDATGQIDVAAACAARLGRRLLVLDQSDLPEAAAEQQTLALLWQRETALLGVALAICCRQVQAGPQQQTLARWLARVQGLVFVCTTESPALPHGRLLRVDKPGAAEQRELWHAALAAHARALPPALVDRMASQFRLGMAEVMQRVSEPVAAQHLWQACREAARPRLEGLAQRVRANAGWADLVLPEPQMQTLRLIVQQLRHRHTVHETWGFAAQGCNGRGLGLAALFHGDSGVGKTMACEVLARELELDLFRIDLSAVVSKYIGETEKNLRAVFDAAEDSGAILLFDEADALFGKRSEVKDSHDRYANIEVGYLLQRMETYGGLAVLTTNQRAALDPAFLRRLRFVVHFPFPDQSQREWIWRRVFPDSLPRESIDFDKLARLPVSGGAIRNIALNAAFLAAEQQTALRMSHLAQAAQLEAAKQERPLADNHTRGWA